MESSGEYFKREREQRGIKLQSVFEATRVPLKYLKAIEADDYAVLPNTVFVKGYIKSYCKFVGIDPNEAILKFEMHFKEQSSSVTPSGLKEIKSSEPGKGIQPFAYPKNTARIAAIVIAVVVLIVIIYSSVTRKNARNADIAAALRPPAAQLPVTPPPDQGQGVKPAEGDTAQKTDQVKPSDGASVKAVDAPMADKAGSKVSSKTELKPEIKSGVKAIAKPEAKQDAKPVSAIAPVAAHTLTLKATQTVWIRVRIDNGEPKEATLQPGESVTWKAAEDYSLLFGNAGGVTLKLDGVDLGAPGKDGEVLSLKLPKGSPLKTTDSPVKPNAPVKKTVEKSEDKFEKKGMEHSGGVDAPKPPVVDKEKE